MNPRYHLSCDLCHLSQVTVAAGCLYFHIQGITQRSIRFMHFTNSHQPLALFKSDIECTTPSQRVAPIIR